MVGWRAYSIRGVKVFTMFRHSPLLTIDSFNEEKMKVGAFSEYCDLYTAKFRCHLYCPCVWRTRGVPCSQHPGDDYHLITLLLPSAACLEMPHLTDSHLPHSALYMSCRNDASNKARVPSRYVHFLPQIRPATVSPEAETSSCSISSSMMLRLSSSMAAAWAWSRSLLGDNVWNKSGVSVGAAVHRQDCSSSASLIVWQ